MLFKKYLTEEHMIYNEDRSQAIDEEKALQLINDKCSQILNVYRTSAARIWRGTDKYGRFYYVDPTKSIRMSRNTTNFYTVLFDNLPSWRNYPKRSHGIISSSYLGGAYNIPYLAFPYNGTKIGVCPTTDLWYSFRDISIYHSLDLFNEKLAELFDYDYNFTTKSELEKIFRSMRSQLQNKATLKSFNNDLFLPGYQYDGSVDLMTFFNRVFHPNIAGFKHFTTKNYNVVGDHEVWFDGEAVLVKNGEIAVISKLYIK